MKLGRKSLLFGAHQVLIHPWFVAWAWRKLYGWPKHPAYYVAFIVHDWGYWSCAAMDDAEGEWHPLLGARIMTRLFDQRERRPVIGHAPAMLVNTNPDGSVRDPAIRLGYWGAFVFLHSRFLAKKARLPYSPLCVADKLAIALTPVWLYLPLASLSGEVDEYMATYSTRSVSGGVHPERLTVRNKREWYAALQPYMRRWAEEHRDGKPDTWTNRRPVDASDGDAVTLQRQQLKGFVGYTGRDLVCSSCGKELHIRHEPRATATDQEPEIVEAGWTCRDGHWLCADCGEHPA